MVLRWGCQRTGFGADGAAAPALQPPPHLLTTLSRTGWGRTARRQQSITPSRPDRLRRRTRGGLGASRARRVGGFRPRNTRRGRGGRRRSGGPTVAVDELVVRLAHPGLAAGVDVAPAAAAELVAGPRTETSRRSGTGAAAPGRGVEPDVLPTAGSGSRTGRGRSTHSPGTRGLSRDSPQAQREQPEGAPR